MKKLGQPHRDNRRGIQSVDASTAILEVFLSNGGAMALSAIAQAAGVPTSTAHRYLVSLQRGGLVVQSATTGLYDLGPAALRLGLAAMRRLDPIGLAEEAARAVTLATGDTSFVSIWSERGPMIIRWFHGTDPIITTAGIGATLPVVGSSTGRVFAAYRERSSTDPLVRKELTAGNYGVSKRPDFDRILEEVKKARFAWIDGLIVSGLRAIAAPIFDLQGHVQATVTIMSPHHSLVEFPNGRLEALLEQTKAASRRLGFGDI